MNLFQIQDQVLDVLDFVQALEALSSEGHVQILKGHDVAVLLSRVSDPLKTIHHNIEQIRFGEKNENI